ncbi:NADH:ubiquinone oxidoreductase subunit 4 (chain M) [Caldisphaera lagunensis DSM 15908]|uniref:NADH:ubiquinone oxidoreductase subunit 4 (Chain M) n=1 Tax=Caldisphaera lagunensis (strain DSM 15908 / JCM 11604 / ANMR 0165 / IC-154) TaxID=1056495 RepID=L0ADF2_CALLD|nr:NADH:ubiquinone oxidoreductase subunit 4 (chain M) [Caldisphaera lagunensis DSM 15908]
MLLSLPALWISLLLPIVLGILAWLLGRYDSAVKALIYLSGFVLLFPLGLVLYYYATGGLSSSIVDPIYVNFASYKIGTFYLGIDGLSAPIVIGISIVTAFVSFYGIKYMTKRIEEMKEEGERVPNLGTYTLLYNIFAVTMLGIAYSSNLIEFYIFLEGTLISSFLTIAFYGYGDRRKISLLYFVWTHIGAVLLLTGILYFGYIVGSFNYMNLVNGSLVPVGSEEAVLGSAATLIAILMLIGLFVKMAVFGVHMWLPYAHAEAPTPISALLSPNLIGLAGYAIARFVFQFFPTIMLSWRPYLLTLAFITIIYGGLVALRQKDFKRFLAYSSISQMGYMLLGLSTLTTYGIIGAMLVYLSHAIGKAILFMSAGVFITELNNLRDITKMGGLAKKYPLTAALALFGFMNLTGLPPSVGMWSEILIVMGLVQSYMLRSLASLVGFTALLIVALTMTGAYSFIMMRRIFYGQPRSKIEIKEKIDVFKLSILGIAIFGFIFFLAINPLISNLNTSIVSFIISFLSR